MATIALELDDNEQAAFGQLLDVALKSAGLGALDVVAHFKVKLANGLAAAGPPAPVAPVGTTEE